MTSVTPTLRQSWIADASHDVQGVLDEADETIADAGGTDTDEDRGPESKLIAPSSMGMRFQVGPDRQPAFSPHGGVNTSPAGRPTRTAARQTYYDRTDHVVPRTIDISAIGAGQTHTEVIVEGHVAISVEVFDHDGLRVVEAALQNTKVTGASSAQGLAVPDRAEGEPPRTRAQSSVPTRDALVAGS